MAGQVVPFYLAPSLGGNNSLRGYSDYRFHDRNLLVLNVETRFALMTHVDAALFFDAGNVAARIENLDLGRRSYGTGVRFHTRRSTFARVDVARSDEGWRAICSLSDPLSLARMSRRTATAPFFP
jgi:outer membrane protein assembly factor BamA